MKREFKLPDLSPLSPPGYDSFRDAAIFGWGMAASAIYSLVHFIAVYTRAVGNLYHPNTHALYPDAMLPGFRDLLGNNLAGFLIVALVMLSFIIPRYASYHRGSKSIYLMRRLPKRREIHKRSIPLPVLAAAIALLTALVLMLIYFAIYMLASPDQCIPPHQWQNLWRI